MAEHDDLIASRRLFVRRESLANDRVHTQHFEKIRRDTHTDNTHGFIRAGQVHPVRQPKHGQCLERPALCLPIRVVGGRGYALVVALSRVALPHGHEPFGFREWQRLQQHPADDAENRGVCADAQCERQHGHRGEAGVFDQLASSVAEVVHSCDQENQRINCSGRGGIGGAGQRSRGSLAICCIR